MDATSAAAMQLDRYMQRIIHVHSATAARLTNIGYCIQARHRTKAHIAKLNRQPNNILAA